MNKLFKKMCGSMNYDTYNIMKAIVDISGCGINLVNFSFLRECLPLNIFLNIFVLSMWTSTFCLDVSRGYIYTKDVQKISELYQEFIKKYNKLNKVFDFNNPISIYAMFNYLVYEGYLSEGKEFNAISKGTINIDVLRGPNVMMGLGVCRHIASMLTDILNNYGMNTVNIGCYMRRLEGLSLVEVKQEEYSREENISMIENFVTDLDKQKDMLLVLKLFEEEGEFIKLVTYFSENDKKLSKKRLNGNHLICFTEFEGKNYYLDPTQSRIYRLNEDGFLFDSFDDKIVIRNKLFGYFNLLENKELEAMKDKSEIIGSSISLEEEKKLLSSTLDLCKNNLDIFEQFYNENKELYSEITNGLSKIRTKRIK